MQCTTYIKYFMPDVSKLTVLFIGTCSARGAFGKFNRKLFLFACTDCSTVHMQYQLLGLQKCAQKTP